MVRVLLQRRCFVGDEGPPPLRVREEREGRWRMVLRVHHRPVAAGRGGSRRRGGCRPGARRRCSSWCAVAPVLRRRSGTAAASERRERRTTDDGAYWCTVSRWRRVEAESAARWQSVRRRREESAKPWKYVNHEVAGRKACIAPCLRMEGMEKGGGGEEPPPVRPHDHLSIVEESRPPVHWELF